MKFVKGELGINRLITDSGKPIFLKAVVVEINHVLSKDKRLSALARDVLGDYLDVRAWVSSLMRDEDKARMIAKGMLNRKIMRDFLITELFL